MTAERFADQRFAFSLSTLLTVQVPEVATVIRREFGISGVLLVGAGLIAAARRRSLEAGLVFAAAVGMLVMVVNLRGDTNGFITPAMALLWPLAGYGIDAAAQWLQSFRLVLGVEAPGRTVPSLRSIRLNLGHGLLAAAMAMPIASLYCELCGSRSEREYGSGACAASDVRATARPRGGGSGRLLPRFRAAISDLYRARRVRKTTSPVWDSRLTKCGRRHGTVAASSRSPQGPGSLVHRASGSSERDSTDADWTHGARDYRQGPSSSARPPIRRSHSNPRPSPAAGASRPDQCVHSNAFALVDRATRDGVA